RHQKHPPASVAMLRSSLIVTSRANRSWRQWTHPPGRKQGGVLCERYACCARNSRKCYPQEAPMRHEVATTLHRVPVLLLILAASLGLSGCEMIKGIFKVGLWAGVILVLLIIAVIWLIARMFR